jgi:multisubunit Na+/H+ antiporter MnhC subunit
MATMLAIAFMVAPLAAIGAWLYRRDRFRKVVMIAALVSVGAWLGMIGVALTGWRDLDGAVDCWPHCSAGQNAVKVLFWGLPLATLLFAIASVSSLLRR